MGIEEVETVGVGYPLKKLVQRGRSQIKDVKQGRSSSWKVLMGEF